MYVIHNPEEFRNNVRVKIMASLSIELETDEGGIHASPTGDVTRRVGGDLCFLELCCGNIEKGIYNYAIQEATKKHIVKKWENQSFVHLYIDKLRSVYINLTSTELIEKIKSHEILPQQIAFMSHHEMNPSKWKQLIERKMMRDASKLNCNIQANTDMYTCSRCKSKKTIYYEMATRSADEQMTIFITCLDCGKNWKR